MFLETSALTGENVEEAFLKCARSILTKIESGSLATITNNLKHYTHGKVFCYQHFFKYWSSYIPLN